MKKRMYLILVAVILLPAAAFTQSSMFTVNWDVSFPTGTTSDYINNTSFRGVSFEGMKFINDNIAIGGMIGWEVFKEKKNDETWEGNGVTVTGTQVRYLNMLPLLVVGRYFLKGLDEVAPYIGLGLGTHRSLQRTEIGHVAFENNNWHLGFAPEVGIFIPMNFNMGLNLAAKYQYAVESSKSQYSYFNLAIGFSFLYY